MNPLPLSEEKFTAIANYLELSQRQTEIVGLVLRGMEDAEIADFLSISVPTVRSHLARIFAKLQVSKRLLLVLKLFALSHQPELVGNDVVTNDDIDSDEFIRER